MNILSRVQVVSCNYEIFTEKVGMMSTGKSLARAIVMSSSVDYSLLDAASHHYYLICFRK